MSNSNQIKNYYPNALMLFVSGFQGNASEKNTYVVSNLQNKSNKLTKEGLNGLIYSISVEMTIRNSPGTFSATLFNTANKLMRKDDPDVEIKSLYNYSRKKRIIVGETLKTVTGKKVETGNVTRENSNIEPGNYFDYSDYNSWLEDENMILEDRETGDRFPLIVLRTKDSISTYWTFDFEGNVLKVQDPTSVDDGKIINITYNKNGNDITKQFILHKLKNSLFVDKYKDTINQGNDRNIFNNGRCRIQSMDRVVIFMSERFSNKKNPDLIRCFTGIVNNVDEGYTEGRASVTITGEDVTKFMKISLVNVNPALLLDNTTDVLQGNSNRKVTIWGDVFKDMTAPNIIKLCTVGGTTDVTDIENLPYKIEGVGSYTLVNSKKSTSGTSLVKFSQEDNSWISIENIKGETKADLSQILGTLFQKSTVHICDPYSKNQDLLGFRPYALSIANSWSFYQGDYKTRREIAYRAAEDSHFVFYADRNGEIWFHPPRFSNSWILGAENPDIYIIDTSSIISYGFVESDENIYTTVFISTEPPLGLSGEQTLGIFNKSFRDDGAILKYGFRIFTASNPVINVNNVRGSKEYQTYQSETDSTKSQNSMLVYAKSLLQRLLAQKYQGQIVITGRPEIDQGRPVYIPYRNMIYYVETVSHQATAGEGFTTTLHLNYGRKPWEFLPELMTMAADDEIYMTDAQLFNNMEVKTEQQSQYTKNTTPTIKTNKKTTDTTNSQNFQILNIDVLSPLKTLLGKSLIITSHGGIRTREENEQAGGEKDSWHLIGCAVDIVAEGLTVIELYNLIKQLVTLGKLRVDKCIYETDHVHIQYKRTSIRNLFYLKSTSMNVVTRKYDYILDS